MLYFSHSTGGNNSTIVYIYIYMLIIGKRSTSSDELTEEMIDDFTENITAQLNKDIVPMPFDLEKELSNIKAHRQKRRAITNQENKYVLYILDSSGSIGKSNFINMTNVIAQLSLFHCSNITKIAVMSYSSYVYKNYCFDCDQSNLLTRFNTISSIPYHGQLTASGDAIQCACDYMLNSPCGFPRITGHNAPEIDVIFITDGHSNRGKDVCTAASCWSSFYNINVFPIGIGKNIDYRELDCIKGKIENGAELFNLKDFNELLMLLAEVKKESIETNGTSCI